MELTIKSALIELESNFNFFFEDSSFMSNNAGQHTCSQDSCAYKTGILPSLPK